MEDVLVRLTKYKDRENFVMYYRDPITDKLVTKSSGQRTQNKAERAAQRWEGQLRVGIGADHRLSWEEFRRRYEDEKLKALSDDAFRGATSAFGHLERIIDPARLSVVNANVVSRYQAALREEGKAETTISTYLGHLHAALSWAVGAVGQGLLRQVPTFEFPKLSRRRLMRRRPITTEEYERMLLKVKGVSPADAAQWKRLLTGLWLSGLRLGEGLRLSWDTTEPFSIDLDGKHPRFRIYSEGQKARRDELLPMTPDFASWLLDAIPAGDRRGRVFPLLSPRTGRLIGRIAYVSSEITAIGESAVVVDKDKGKYASAHDFRRAFGTRWSKRVMPAQLQRLMRHASIETTMRYYVEQQADDLAADLWQKFEGHSTEASTPAENTPVLPQKDR